ncbi:Rab family GTPase [Entamoeba histolytica HM-1:IMSS-B]|uniref:Rab family GTPase n=2 Tax=Entamoeba TaxID=5758 RepID=M3UTK1_ENTH1|nr:Rab family GTPase [Entamoeba histolytica HM-1:IMSS-B]
MTEKKDWDYLLKFLIIGDTAVGKTAMLLRYTDNTFTDAFIATIGVDFKVKKMEVNGKRLKIQVVC